jgi:pyridoxine 5-phosphate synthase
MKPPEGAERRGEVAKVTSAPKIRLGINIDHVATLRNARGGLLPDPIRAAQLAADAGADNITAHLREDRRHIRDNDIVRLLSEIDCPLNMEMAATEEMTGIALKARPPWTCLVPERREERTTEGGLDVVAQYAALAPVVAALSEAGIEVSLFIGAERPQIEAAARLAVPAIEIHTGGWCDAVAEGRDADAETEWQAIVDGAAYAHTLGLEVHAGHGLNYATAEQISTIPEIVELNIGHFLVGEAVFVGLGDAIRGMRAAMDRGRAALRAREGGRIAS